MKYSTYLRVLCLVVISLLSYTGLQAQANLTPSQQRAELLKKNESKLIYPFVKGGLQTGVMPVPEVGFQITKGKTYKLVFDFSVGSGSIYSQGQVNPGLEEICRILNLHSAAGVADKNLDIYIITHGPGIWTLLDETVYKEKYGKENANAPLIRALREKGVKIVACGQTMQLRELKLSQMLSGVTIGYSAKTSVSTLQMQGYVLFPIDTLD
jgi:intracellular sulfur oxidation DsrE/DsrF family protein